MNRRQLFVYKLGQRCLTCTSIHPYYEANGQGLCSPWVEELSNPFSQLEEGSGALEMPSDSDRICPISGLLLHY